MKRLAPFGSLTILLLLALIGCDGIVSDPAAPDYPAEDVPIVDVPFDTTLEADLKAVRAVDVGALLSAGRSAASCSDRAAHLTAERWITQTPYDAAGLNFQARLIFDAVEIADTLGATAIASGRFQGVLAQVQGPYWYRAEFELTCEASPGGGQRLRIAATFSLDRVYELATLRPPATFSDTLLTSPSRYVLYANVDGDAPGALLIRADVPGQPTPGQP